MRLSLHSILIVVGLIVFGFMASTTLQAQESLKGHNVLDCSKAALESARKEMRRQIEPYLYTTAEEYSGNPQVLAEKEAGRNKILVQWIKMRCTCDKGLTDFEKTLCLAMKQNLRIGDSDSCLIRY